MLGELHRDGATICMVTHDPRFARHAPRSVHLFDGRIVDDEGRVVVSPESAPDAGAVPPWSPAYAVQG
jgi:ABC-type siderophore export system fused ATPase/permease subunit